MARSSVIPRTLAKIHSLSNPMTSGSLAQNARRRRWSELISRFPELPDMRVLDLGGTPRSWLIAPEMPAHVTTVNLLDLEQPDDDRITVVTGNACDPSDFVRNKAYDLVFSNSLMEHVGGHLPRLQLADVIAKSAPRYWVQTPYRYFPVEPHWVFPGMQFLPLKARAFVAQTWPGGNRDVSTAEQSIDDCEWVELLDITAMRSYFPDAVIWHERFAGLVKSIVAVKA